MNDTRRWELQSRLFSSAYAFGGADSEGAKGWKELFDSTRSVEDRRREREEKEREELEMLELDRKLRMERFLALEERKKQQAAKVQQEQQTGVDSPDDDRPPEATVFRM